MFVQHFLGGLLEESVAEEGKEHPATEGKKINGNETKHSLYLFYGQSTAIHFHWEYKFLSPTYNRGYEVINKIPERIDY